MRLLPYPVTLILFAVTVIATPPSGYVKRPDTDKDPPNYQYKYEIGDIDGNEGQGKVETRSGELASGRYYVNGEQSSTDVKYFADEWGYHPLVKYSASGDHSAATTHFALGEHVVKSLLNGSEVGEEVKLSGQKGPNQLHRQQLHRRRRPVQVIQPYTPAVVQDTSATRVYEEASLKSQSIEDHEFASSTASPINSPLNYDLQRTVSRGSVFHEAFPSASGFQQHFNNYVTVPQPNHESAESSELSASNQDRLQEISFSRTSTTPDYRSYSRTNLYVTNPSTLPPLSSEEVDGHANSNDLYSTVSDDLLVVQNAGSFGRRLNPASSKAYGNSVDFQNQNKVAENIGQSYYESSTSRPISSTTSSRDTYSDVGTSSYGSYSTTTPRTSISYPTESLDDGRHYSTTAIPKFQDLRNSGSPETSSNDYKNSITEVHQDNSVSGAYAGIFAKIFPNNEASNSREHGNSLVAGNSQLIHYGDAERNENVTNENRITTPGLSSYGKRRDHELYVTLRQSLDSEIQGLPLLHSSTPQSVSTFNSKPIVVAELFDHNSDKGFEYSTTFPCKDEGLESSTISPSVSSTASSIIDAHNTVLVTPKLRGSHSHITTSSVILNPIQAGVSLVNAGETELITSDEKLNRSPAPVNENIEGESDVDAIKNLSVSHSNELGKLGTETRVELYEKINPAFGHLESGAVGIGKSIVNSDTLGNIQSDAPVLENSQDQQIEIQKSVEIYQNAPVHEIHYPAQVISQVSGINHQQQQQQQRQNDGGLAHQQEEQSSYLQLQEVGNAKQFDQEEERYSGGQVEQHQSLNTQISLESSQVNPTGGTAYLGNLVRHDNELVDYTTQQNSHNQVLNPGQDDHVNIIKLIRDNIPDVKYTSAKLPQINVQVYPTNVAEVNNQQQIETHQEIVDVRQQQKSEADAEQDRANQARSQLQMILSESGSVQRYFSGAEWTRFQAQQEQHQRESQQQAELQEAPKLELRRLQPIQENRPEEVNYVRTEQPQQQQSIVVPYAHYDSVNEKNLQQNLGNLVEEIENPGQPAPQLYPTSPVAERVVEKLVHVPQPYPVEVPKIIEKKVPYPVEKIVEKKVPYPVEKIVERKVPQPYPVHIQVPVDRVVEKQVQILQPYPVHIEKIIEKKVPYPVQRLVPQPYPVHIPYPVEKIVEKPVHIPVTIEKIVEKKVHVPHPYPVQIPIKVPYPVEITKYIEQSVQVPYGVRYGVSYQQIMKPQSSHGLYAPQGSTSVPLYGLSLVSNQYRDHNRVNATQQVFQGYTYNKPAIAFVTGRVDQNNNQPRTTNGWEQFAYGKSAGLDHQHHHQGFAKKSYSNHSPKLSPLSHPSYSYSVLNRRQAPHRQSNSVGAEKVGSKDEYVGPVPALQQHKPQQQVELSQSNPHQKSRSRSSSDQQPEQQQQQQQLLPLQPLQQHSTAVTRAALVSTAVASSRRVRQQQQENPPHYQTGPGAFRQSKIEYGFKPPMIPSVQYDEKTATKVEN